MHVTSSIVILDTYTVLRTTSAITRKLDLVSEQKNYIKYFVLAPMQYRLFPVIWRSHIRIFFQIPTLYFSISLEFFALPKIINNLSLTFPLIIIFSFRLEHSFPIKNNSSSISSLDSTEDSDHSKENYYNSNTD